MPNVTSNRRVKSPNCAARWLLVGHISFVLLREELRADARDTIAYFRAQGVALKVISGDSPLTAAAVAQAAGVPGVADPLDGSVLPRIVAEGRRILANIERVAVLFLTKTTYATLLILAVSLLGWPFPLLPRHFTLIGSFTIGIPAFFLALGPSAQPFRPGLLRRILRIALPAGTAVALAVLASLAATRSGLSPEAQRSLATAVASLAGLGVLALIARPLLSWRGALVLIMAAGVGLAFALPLSRGFFALSWPGVWP